MLTKQSARIRGRSYAEGQGNYRTEIENHAGGWVAVVKVECGQMWIDLPLELEELDRYIAELQKARIKLAEDVSFSRKSA